MSLPTSHKPIVAAFDFDGTITTRDTLLAFLFFVAGKWTTSCKLLKLIPCFIAYLLGKKTRQEVKEAILKRFFAGMPISQMRELGESFAKSPALNRLVRREAKKRIEWHLRQKHLCILISASVDVYLDPWGSMVGFEDVICSKLEIDPSGTVTGKLQGPNCWGPEKWHRLEKLLGPRENFVLYVYGDSLGDKDILENADFSFYRTMA